MQTEVPSVETIMNEIRSGLENSLLSETAVAAAAAGSSLQSDLRNIAESASVLGRCGGSRRGRLCRLLASPARPVVEQLDRFHDAVCSALGNLAGRCGEQTETARKVADLERRLQVLEAHFPETARNGDNR